MDVINSFFSNVKDKLTNPYFGTLIIVLLLHHWELIFGIFNFDAGNTLTDKIQFVETYIDENLTWGTFLWDALSALGFMLLGYMIVVGTRSFVLFIEHWVMPAVTGKVVHKNVVRRTEYNDVVKEREEYFDQYEEQRKQVREFSKAIDEQTFLIKEKDESLINQSARISETTNQIESLNSKLERVRAELKSIKSTNEQLENSNRNLKFEKERFLARLEGFQKIFYSEENVGFYQQIDKFPPEVTKKVSELIDENSWDLFLKVARFYLFGGTSDDDSINEMARRGLVFKDGDINFRALTPLGDLIYSYRDVLGNPDLYKIY